MKKALNIDIIDQTKRMIPIIIGTVLMSIVCQLLKQISNSFAWNVISILIAIALYFAILIVFKTSRDDIKQLLNKK